MNPSIKAFLPGFLQVPLHRLWRLWQYYQWKLDHFPVPPPPLLKQRTVAAYQKLTGISVFIETGTYRGDMIAAQNKKFRNLYSIELNHELYQHASRRFANLTHIKILNGDSSIILPEILCHITGPAIFWLDAHYSYGITSRGDKDCPIFEELNAILNHTIKNHVLLIDDARDFTGTGDYPSIPALSEFILARNKNYRIEVEQDIIRCIVPDSSDSDDHQ
jgi:hypothetical protein